MATASDVFDFLVRHPELSIIRVEIASVTFGALRRALRPIVVELRACGDYEAEELGNRLRAFLSEWLTVPVPFNDTILNSVQILGASETVQRRWGSRIRSFYDAAQTTANNLLQEENPVRVELLDTIRELRFQNRTFKIYCHRTARPFFQSLPNRHDDAPLGDELFLHSAPDYRDSQPFDSLIKVGPLRSMGWGSAPDALISAPRYSTLLQFVWSGCHDEPGFGYDPVSPANDAAISAGGLPVTGSGALGNRIVWQSRVRRSGEDAGGSGEADEFQVFRESNQTREKRRATLVQIGREHGILYPPLSHVLSFDPAAEPSRSLAQRIPGETLTEGIFLVRPIVADLDLGGLQAAHGYYSRIWKARLNAEYERSSANLRVRLREEGIDLSYLDFAIANWRESPTTVIHAPQKRQHFEILIRVLEIDAPPARGQTAPWWECAWNEIRRSRGEAIQAGFQEHNLIEEQVLESLGALLSDIHQNAETSTDFTIPVISLNGVALFSKVSLIEEGFLVPDTDLKVVHELRTIDQWRV